MKKVPTKVAVSYHLYIGPPSYINNLIFFLKFALSAQVDIFVSISGISEVPNYLPQHPRIVYTIVPNRNFDLGGHVENSKIIAARDHYDYVFFVNCSVRGPFLPAYYQGKWFDPFLSLFDHETGAVASSMNLFLPKSKKGFSILAQKLLGTDRVLSHMQSSCFCLKYSVFNDLLPGILSESGKCMTKDEAIVEYEISLSQEILSLGYRIKCLLPEYNSTDYRQGSFPFNFHTKYGDVLKKGAYFGRTPHPYELVFAKTNRGLYSRQFFSALLTTEKSSRHDSFPDIAFLPEIEIPDTAPWSVPNSRYQFLRRLLKRLLKRKNANRTKISL